MIKIKIIREAQLPDFEEQLNILLAEQWKLKGELIINDGFLYQVLIKTTSPKKYNN